MSINPEIQEKLKIVGNGSLSVVTLQTNKLTIDAETVAEEIRTINQVEGVIVRQDNSLVVAFSTCTLDKIKGNIARKLQPFLK